MADYSAEIAMALEMIQDAGLQVTLKRKQSGTLNKVTDRETTPAAPLTNTPYVVSLPVDARRDGFVIDTKELTKHRKLLMAASGMTMTPQAEDTVATIEGSTWVVVDNLPLVPDGSTTPIIHKVLVKN